MSCIKTLFFPSKGSGRRDLDVIAVAFSDCNAEARNGKDRLVSYFDLTFYHWLLFREIETQTACFVALLSFFVSLCSQRVSLSPLSSDPEIVELEPLPRAIKIVLLLECDPA